MGAATGRPGGHGAPLDGHASRSALGSVQQSNRPSIDIEQGVTKFVEWYKDFYRG
jgi:hypothetical protein